eukprot:scaffold139825_cov33-Tisochrysis_lutea.AAC.4
MPIGSWLASVGKAAQSTQNSPLGLTCKVSAKRSVSSSDTIPCAGAARGREATNLGEPSVSNVPSSPQASSKGVGSSTRRSTSF